jgi:hypothetical protein
MTSLSSARENGDVDEIYESNPLIPSFELP